MKVNKEKRFIKNKNEENNQINKSIKNSIIINNHKKSIKIPKRKEIKEIIITNNNNTSRSIKINFTSNNNKEQNYKNHRYLNTDVDINSKFNRNIKQKSRNEIIKEFNSSTSKNKDNNNYRNINKRSINKDKNIFSSFIERKKDKDKNKEQIKSTIEPYGYRNMPKPNQKMSNKKNNNNNTIFANKLNYNNGINKIGINKNNNSNNNSAKNNLYLSQEKKYNRTNKSTDLRPKIRNTLYNNMKKVNDFKIKEKENGNNTERKTIKRKIKTDKNNIYKGPLDTKNLIISDSIESIHTKIVKSLHINQIKYWKLNPLKYSCCAKNMDKFYIEICLISELEEYKGSISKNNDIEILDDNNDSKSLEMKYLFYIKLLLSKEINDIPNCKLLEKVINSIKAN